ncbi:i-spanin [Stenotrophomonas phage Moby]|uniref:I-spanin n=1 Tax=Stenotrophomonas phage Moby TaxID=2601680 RepID=A0A5P8PMD4_9CAUD|nr:i-spanin [Stenotrophomonas phage Moby]QFR57842.1 i-spanin [Stenotrophomonas phage Moby]
MLNQVTCTVGGILIGVGVTLVGIDQFAQPLFPTQNPAVYQKMVELCGESEFKEITLSETLESKYLIEVKCMNGITASAEINR